MNTQVPPPRYPRTPYWPWSPSGPPEHRFCPSPEAFTRCEIVLTEKLDGASAALHHGRALTRDGGSATAPWLHMARRHHAWKTGNLDTVIYAEDLLAVHSIAYGPIPERETLRAFAALRDGRFISQDELTNLLEELSIPQVPVVFRGTAGSIRQLHEIILEAHAQPSVLGGEREGVVVRTADAFPQDEFAMRVCKSVRPGHVRPGQAHWRRNWQRARIIEEIQAREDRLEG